MLLGDQGADLGVFVHRVGHPEQGGALLESSQKLLGQPALHKHAGAVGTNLPLRVKISHHGGRYRLLEVSIIKHQQRRFAAKLHG